MSWSKKKANHRPGRFGVSSLQLMKDLKNFAMKNPMICVKISKVLMMTIQLILDAIRLSHLQTIMNIFMLLNIQKKNALKLQTMVKIISTWL